MDKENVIFCKIHSEFVPIVNIVFLAGSRTPKTIITNTGGQRFTGNYVLMISTNYYSEALAEFFKPENSMQIDLGQFKLRQQNYIYLY